MSTMHRLFVLLALAGISCAVHAGEPAEADDLGEACTYKRPRFESASSSRPQFKRAGDMAVGGQKIPAYSLSLADGGRRNGGYSTFAPDGREPHILLKPEIAGRLQAYATPMGMVLVPAGWVPVSGAEGADGSFIIYFAPDGSGLSYMSVENTAACVGCAYSGASRYFRRAQALARSNGFAYCRSVAGVRTALLNPVQRAYRVRAAGGNPVTGLAYFNPDDDLMYYEVEISIAPSQHALAATLLNQFVISRTSK